MPRPRSARPSEGLVTGEITYDVAASRCRPTAPRPRRQTSLPVVLVVQEIFGVHEHIKDIAAASPGRLPGRRAGAVRPPGRRVEDHRHPGDHRQGGLQGARRAGDGRPRRDGRLGQEGRQGRHGEARHHRLLLGRPHRLAVRGAQQGPEGGRGLVRPAGRRQADDLHPKHPIDLVGDAEGAGAGPVRRRRPGHPARDGREDAQGAQGREARPAEIVVYPDTPHGFNADYRPSYRKERGRGRLEARCWRGSRRTACA